MNITDLQGCPENYWEMDKNFHGLFGTHINKFLDTLLAVGLFSFDIVAFEEYCQRYKWHAEDKALSESIRNKFGEEAENLVRDLANTPNIA